MLSGIVEQDVSWGLAEAVHRQTEGNPLFVQEVVRYLVEEGLLTREGGRWRAAGSTPLAMSIPEGLRDVIGKRLSRLSPACNRMLATAAVIGRDFDLATLQAVATLDEEALLDALDEAVGVAVLEERALVGGVRYRFSHALFRQTLYEELIVPRRLRLHQQIARSLEARYGARLEEHAAELAEHFAHSSDPADLAKAVAYGELAARGAIEVYAFGEAARLLEQALAVQEVLDPDDQARRCDLFLFLGEVLRAAGQPLRVADEIAPQALTLAAALADRQRTTRTCLLALVALVDYGARWAWATPAYRQWAERADREALPETPERVGADIFLSDIRIVEGRFREALALSEHALELARRLDDPETFVAAANNYFGSWTAPHHWRTRLRLADECTARQWEGVSLARLVRLWFSCAVIYLTWGDRPRGEALIRRVRERTAPSKDASGLAFRAVAEVWQTAANGQPEATLSACRQFALAGEEFGRGASSPALSGAFALRPLLDLGRAEEALAAVEELATSADQREDAGYSLMLAIERGLCLANLGRRDEASAALATLMEVLTTRDPDGVAAEDLLNLLDTAVRVGDRAAAGSLAERLAPIDSLVLDPGMGGQMHAAAGSVARLLGAAAALAGDQAGARRYCEQALADTERIGFRSEAALCHLQLAEVLLDEGEPGRREALEHLEFAIDEFRAMKMQPALERALRLKEVLDA